MYTVSLKIDNYDPRRFIYVNLNPDQALNPYTWRAPITWSGFVAGTPVTIIQNENSAFDIDDFDWSGLPSEYSYLRSEIREAIDKAMKVMD